jgi:site-specific DNA-methyltransferase (cytosine-N4-specific)
MSKCSKPKADNRRVLIPYSKDMKGLLKKQDYNGGKRPSGHVISENGFLKDHGGSISASVVDSADQKRFPESLLQFSNTKWDAKYSDFCRENDLPAHPARMPIDLAAFMIQFLTEPGDLVLDPFAGSNTTGAAAEMLDRRWVSIEVQEAYINGSQSRFENSILERSKTIFQSNDLTREINNGDP